LTFSTEFGDSLGRVERIGAGRSDNQMSGGLAYFHCCSGHIDQSVDRH
jgi:hypothetical protein